MNFKEFDYEFDLNGHVVLKNTISRKRINKINKIIKSLEEKKETELPYNVFFGKKNNKSEAYISNILEADHEFEKISNLAFSNISFLYFLKRTNKNERSTSLQNLKEFCNKNEIKLDKEDLKIVIEKFKSPKII
jgi:hypothetical protein